MSFLYILGATQAIQNAGLFLIPLLVGPIKEADSTYVWFEIFFIGWLAFSILATALMWFLDFKKANYLFMSDKQRKVFETTPEYLQIMAIEKW